MYYCPSDFSDSYGISWLACCFTVDALSVWVISITRKAEGAPILSLTQEQGKGCCAREQSLLIEAATTNGDQVGEDAEIVHMFGPWLDVQVAWKQEQEDNDFHPFKQCPIAHHHPISHGFWAVVQISIQFQSIIIGKWSLRAFSEWARSQISDFTQQSLNSIKPEPTFSSKFAVSYIWYTCIQKATIL